MFFSYFKLQFPFVFLDQIENTVESSRRDTLLLRPTADHGVRFARSCLTVRENADVVSVYGRLHQTEMEIKVAVKLPSKIVLIMLYEPLY